MSEFERARHETVRYHEELYASAGLGQAGTWLARPHRLLLDALAQIPSGRPIIAYDLGAGIGRHTIPMMRQLPVGSEVYAVDLLPSALHSLRRSVPPELGTVLHTRHADLDDFLFETPADLVLGFSAIEHLHALEAIRGLLGRVRAAVRPGGVVAIGFVAIAPRLTARGTAGPRCSKAGYRPRSPPNCSPALSGPSTSSTRGLARPICLRTGGASATHLPQPW